MPRLSLNSMEMTSMQDDILLYYPCNYCGECTAWLAAYVPEGLETHEDLLAECYRRKCPIVNTPVPKEVLYHG